MAQRALQELGWGRIRAQVLDGAEAEAASSRKVDVVEGRDERSGCEQSRACKRGLSGLFVGDMVMSSFGLTRLDHILGYHASATARQLSHLERRR